MLIRSPWLTQFNKPKIKSKHCIPVSRRYEVRFAYLIIKQVYEHCETVRALCIVVKWGLRSLCFIPSECPTKLNCAACMIVLFTCWPLLNALNINQTSQVCIEAACAALNRTWEAVITSWDRACYRCVNTSAPPPRLLWLLVLPFLCLQNCLWLWRVFLSPPAGLFTTTLPCTYHHGHESGRTQPL